ncbi:hypothetical protein D3C73_1291350 [compost metagenome]
MARSRQGSKRADFCTILDQHIGKTGNLLRHPSANRRIGLAGAKRTVTSQQAGITFRNTELRFGQQTFQRVDGSDMIIMRMGQNDSRKRLAKLLRERNDSFQTKRHTCVN